MTLTCWFCGGTDVPMSVGYGFLVCGRELCCGLARAHGVPSHKERSEIIDKLNAAFGRRSEKAG